METITNQTPSFAKRDASLRHYCAMGVGTAVIAGAVTTADASVVYTNYNNQIFNDTNTADTLSTNYGFDVNNDGIQDFRFFIRNAGATSTSNYAIIVAGVNGSSLSPINIVGTTVGAYTYPSRLGAGASVGAAQGFVTLSLTSSGSFLKAGTFAYGNGFTNSKWKTAGANSGYLGFSFTYGGALHYGFVGMTVAPQSTGSLSRAISIGGIGYESTANTAISAFGSVGAIPEPSSLALLAAGGLGGVAAYRRRRNAASRTPVEA